MARIYQITYDGVNRGTWETSANAVNISYGSNRVSVDAGEKTVNCDVAHIMTDNLIIGELTLPCAGKRMKSAVKIVVSKPTVTITITGKGTSAFGTYSEVQISGTEYKEATTLTVDAGTTIGLRAIGSWLSHGTVTVNGQKVVDTSSGETYNFTVNSDCAIKLTASTLSGTVTLTGGT